MSKDDYKNLDRLLRAEVFLKNAREKYQNTQERVAEIVKVAGSLKAAQKISPNLFDEFNVANVRVERIIAVIEELMEQ